MANGLTARGEQELRTTMVREVSRTFALSIEVLPHVLRDAMSIGYLLFRVSDSIEDHPDLSSEHKVLMLRQWATILDEGAPVATLTHLAAELPDQTVETSAIRNAPLIVDWLNDMPDRFQEPVRQHVVATSVGMARWQEHGPYIEDEIALDDYMHEVAGRVGYLVTDLYVLYSPAVRARYDRLMPLSRQCGLALQTVNILRGLGNDRDRGWVFVPQSYYEPFGLTRETLFDPQYRTQAMQVVDLLVEKAGRHLDYGYEYVVSFPRTDHSLRLSLMWPFLFAARTLAVCRDNPLVMTSAAKISRAEVQDIVIKSRLFGWSNSWLHHYYESMMAAQPVHIGQEQTFPVPSRNAQIGESMAANGHTEVPAK